MLTECKALYKALGNAYYKREKLWGGSLLSSKAEKTVHCKFSSTLRGNGSSEIKVSRILDQLWNLARGSGAT